MLRVDIFGHGANLTTDYDGRAWSFSGCGSTRFVEGRWGIYGLVSLRVVTTDPLPVPWGVVMMITEYYPV
jgi:hypothetical protein